MAPNNALNYLDKIMDEYTSGTTLNPEVGQFLNDCDSLTGEDRKKLSQTLVEMKIDSVKKLETELLRVGRDLVKDLLRSPEKTERPTQLITAENVAELIRRNPADRAVRLLSTLSPEKQVKALNMAGVKMLPQFNVLDNLQMQRIVNAVGTVMTGIGEKRGGSRMEISTPMGGKARR